MACAVRLSLILFSGWSRPSPLYKTPGEFMAFILAFSSPTNRLQAPCLTPRICCCSATLSGWRSMYEFSSTATKLSPTSTMA